MKEKEEKIITYLKKHEASIIGKMRYGLLQYRILKGHEELKSPQVNEELTCSLWEQGLIKLSGNYETQDGKRWELSQSA